jgi:DeoR family transcriptional regulator, aga operon transcriptional repressor
MDATEDTQPVRPPAPDGDGEAALEPAQLAVRADERRDRMLDLINEQTFVRVGELSSRFGISEVTARSDLAVLAKRGQIKRIRGGAMSRGVAYELPFEESLSSFAAEKRAIGSAAGALVGDGESLIIDVGTTAVAAARALVARTELRDVVVFTNGLKTALELEPAIPRMTVIVLGGTLRPLQHSLVEPLATHTLGQISVNTLLMGCNGIHPTGGITNVNLPEAQVKRQMLKVARHRIVLADGSKLGRIELSRLCAIDEVDMVITGESADPTVVEALRERGCDVRVVR